MFRALWAMGKTYLTIKAVEMVASAFKRPAASAKASKRAPARKRATA